MYIRDIIIRDIIIRNTIIELDHVKATLGSANFRALPYKLELRLKFSGNFNAYLYHVAQKQAHLCVFHVRVIAYRPYTLLEFHFLDTP